VSETHVGTVGSAVQGSPMKLLIVTVSKPLLFLVSRKEIKPARPERKKDRRQLSRWLGDDPGKASLEALWLGPAPEGSNRIGPAKACAQQPCLCSGCVLF
jgi:hypothetical protein